MKLNAADAKGFVFADFGDFVVGDLRAIHNRHRACAENFQYALVVKNYRRIFVNADAEIIRIIRYRSNQAADAPAFGKMLVNDDVF